MNIELYSWFLAMVNSTSDDIDNTDVLEDPRRR